MMPGAAADDRKKLGAAGEAAAARFLRKAGCRIVARNYRCPSGEIDLIARKRGLIIFVEVKTQKTGAHLDPLERVNREKQRHIIASARHFLREKEMTDTEYRYDVVAIIWGDGKRPERIEHHPGAFTEARR